MWKVCVWGGGIFFFSIWIWELQWKKQPVENRGDSFISSLEKPLVWYLIDEGELFPKRVFFFFFFFFILSWQPRRRIIVPFHVWTLFCSLSLSHCARMSSCILPLGKYWEIGEARSRWVEGNEWAAGAGRRERGCCEIWNRCCTNRMGATAFQFGQISCAIFLNITKTNYPGPWCMFLLLWKTIKLCKWLMPFHTARFSLWISKVFFFLSTLSMFKAKAIVLKKSPWCLSS